MATSKESTTQKKSETETGAEQQHILSDEDIRELRKDHRRELYAELKEKREKEEEKVRRAVYVLLKHDGRTEISIKGISGMRRGEANRMGVLIGKTLLTARGHSRRTGKEEYTHVW